MNTNNRITNVIIIILLLIVIFIAPKSCKNSYPVILTDTIQDIRTIYDTIEKDTTIYLPGNVIVKKIYKVDTMEVDTQAIIDKWLTEKIITNDTIYNDSSLFLFLSDTVYQNRIQARKITMRDYDKTIIIDNNIYRPTKHSISAGVEYNTFPAIVAEYSHKEDWEVEIGVSLNKQLTLGVKKRIWNKH